MGTEAEPGRVGIIEVDRSALVLDTRDLEAALDELPESLRAAALELRALAEHGDKAEVARKALWQLVQQTVYKRVSRVVPELERKRDKGGKQD